jgi:putative CocE/NonD family hydrolase
MTRPLPVLFALVTFAPSVAAQAPAAPRPDDSYVKAHYTKFEYKVPMRDGVKLFTAVYVPKDDSQPYPFHMTRTPYSISPYGVDQYRASLGPSMSFTKAGYIFVYQDVRGCWMSEGQFVNMRPHNPNKAGPKDVDESSDTYDTVEWLIKNIPNNNGKVGQSGISYPGFYTAAGMIDAHPALVASSPQAPVTDWFSGDDFHHNGAFFLPHCFNFMAGFGKARSEPTKRGPRNPFDHGTPDGYDFFLQMGSLANADAKYFHGEIAFWKELMAHGTFDEFWKARNLRQHIHDIRPAVLTVGGWFDAENLYGALETFKKAENGKTGGPNCICMGPWNHGGWSRGDGEKLGDLHFASKTGEYFREQVELPFFEFHLKGKGNGKLAKAVVFETGTNRWRKYDAWPPKGAVLTPLVPQWKRYLALGKEGYIFDNGNIDDLGYDEFTSDPSKPVPFIEQTLIGMPNDYMTRDQRFASRRPDVLTYTTPVLENDVTIAGPIDVELWVSTTGTDADWIVKVVDVYPADFPDADPASTTKMGNYHQLVRAEIMRGKFREGLDKPKPFEPGKPTLVKFSLPDANHTFRPGHRIQVQVQSSWFPLVDRNPQTFGDIYAAKDSDFKAQTHKVYRDAEHPSKVTVRVVK